MKKEKPKRIKFYASLWALDPWDIKPYVKAFEETKMDGLHFDIMDGHYVPNVAMGVDEMPLWHKLTKIPLDIHCMAIEPEKVLSYYDIRKGDRVCFHPEVCLQPYRLLQELKEKGYKVGYAMSPGITMDYVKEALPVLDYVHFMSINPGFFGKPWVPNAIDKLKRLRAICDEADHYLEITVDGSIIPEHGKLYVENGADALVAGPSTLEKYGPKRFKSEFKKYLKEVGITHEMK